MELPFFLLNLAYNEVLTTKYTIKNAKTETATMSSIPNQTSLSGIVKFGASSTVFKPLKTLRNHRGGRTR